MSLSVNGGILEVSNAEVWGGGSHFHTGWSVMFMPRGLTINYIHCLNLKWSNVCLHLTWFTRLNFEGTKPHLFVQWFGAGLLSDESFSCSSQERGLGEMGLSETPSALHLMSSMWCWLCQADHYTFFPIMSFTRDVSFIEKSRILGCKRNK